MFFIFTRIPWGNDPIWLRYFSDGWFNHQLVYKLPGLEPWNPRPRCNHHLGARHGHRGLCHWALVTNKKHQGIQGVCLKLQESFNYLWNCRLVSKLLGGDSEDLVIFTSIWWNDPILTKKIRWVETTNQTTFETAGWSVKLPFLFGGWNNANVW